MAASDEDEPPLVVVSLLFVEITAIIEDYSTAIILVVETAGY